MKYIFIVKLLRFILFIVITTFLSHALAVDNCLTINQIKVANTNKYFDKKIHKITQKYLGQCLNIDDIQNIIREITNLYTNMGYITTRVILPEQDISLGNLQLEVVEGYVESIDIANKHKLMPPFIPLQTNKLLSLRDIEQTYDHYSRVSSNDVNITIQPGKEQGASRILIVNNPKKKWKVKAGIDNSGSKHKGEILSYTNLTVENFLGLNEAYIFNIKRSVDDPAIRYSNSKSFLFSLPFEYCDLSYQYNFSKNRSFIDSNNKKYRNSGASAVYKVDLSRILHRDGKSKTSLSTGFGHDIYSNFLDDSEIQISSYKIHKVDFGLSYQGRLSASVLSLDFNVTSGINKGFYSKFGNVAVPSRKFNKINLNASWFKPTPIIIADRNVQFRSMFSAQYSPNMLVSSEKFSLGGPSSVRGFKEYRENADNALLLRNELVVFLPQKESKIYQKFFGDFNTFIAFDIGHFSNYEEQTERRGTLSGVAAGIRNSNGVFDIDVVISRPAQSHINYKHKNIIYFSVGVNV